MREEGILSATTVNHGGKLIFPAMNLLVHLFRHDFPVSVQSLFMRAAPKWRSFHGIA
jgi:hypothetical protein